MTHGNTVADKVRNWVVAISESHTTHAMTLDIPAWLIHDATTKSAFKHCTFEQLAKVNSEQIPSLSFLSNFDRLSADQKNAILSDSECVQWFELLRKALWHQHALFERYPLAFIFQDRQDFDRDEAVIRLKEDVQDLFDRRSHHATKVQTTAVVGMMAAGKLILNSSINFPDPNRVFDAPDSPEARMVASFVRATQYTQYGKGGRLRNDVQIRLQTF